MDNEYARYIIKSADALVGYGGYEPVWLDVEKDFDALAEYYLAFGCAEIVRDEFVAETKGVYRFCGVVANGHVVAIGAAVAMGGDSIEIGAVGTLPEYRGRGISKCVCAFIAAYILGSGTPATLGTAPDNAPMRRVAESIGMTARQPAS